MVVDLPFSRISIRIGEPLMVESDADDTELEMARLQREQSLNEATAKVYELVGSDEYKVTSPNATDAEAPAEATGVGLKLYRVVTRISSRAAPFVLRHRQKRGKEDGARLSERYGVTQRARPDGVLAWFHAASVGETNAILPLFNALREHTPDVRYLLTTGTVTSAKLASERLHAHDIHQYAPLDTPQYMRRFLQHWRPELAVLTESEIWPNLIMDAYDHKIPLAIVNGRMSERSYQRWRKNKSMAAPLFSRLQLVLAQNALLTRRFKELGARDVRNTGNLKIDAPQLPVDSDKQRALIDAIGDRPVWMAASTHPGEDEIVLEAHTKLSTAFPDLLTIIAPRHPERGTAICEAACQKNLTVAQRSKGDLPVDSEIYIADTIGELGTLYSIVPIAFIGGSITRKGGQNPVEAIRFGTNILTGPDQRNFIDAYSALLQNNGAVEVSSAEQMASTVRELLTDETKKALLTNGATAALETLTGALERTVDALLPLLPPGNQGLKRAS